VLDAALVTRALETAQSLLISKPTVRLVGVTAELGDKMTVGSGDLDTESTV
jgi:hypothetical protein